jgi:hypothetical protein
LMINPNSTQDIPMESTFNWLSHDIGHVSIGSVGRRHL